MQVDLEDLNLANFPGLSAAIEKELAEIGKMVAEAEDYSCPGDRLNAVITAKLAFSINKQTGACQLQAQTSLKRPARKADTSTAVMRGGIIFVDPNQNDPLPMFDGVHEIQTQGQARGVVADD